VNTQYRARTFAQTLGISKQRVSSLLHSGKLHGLKLGRDMLIDLADPQNLSWLEKRDNLPAELARKVSLLRQDPSCLLSDEETDEDLFTASDVEDVLRQAFACDSGNIECALDTYSHLKLGRKIAKAARSAKDIPSAVKTVERAVNTFLKMYAKEIKLDGDCFIKAWREDDLGYYMNGPSDEELEVDRKEIAAARSKKRPRGSRGESRMVSAEKEHDA
jgi:hypothetical protein